VEPQIPEEREREAKETTEETEAATEREEAEEELALLGQMEVEGLAETEGQARLLVFQAHP
jgi:hypothetical protein